MTSNNRRFSSALAGLLNKYLEFKQALGYTSFAEWGVPTEFDQYLNFRFVASVEALDERFINEWLHSLPAHAAATKNGKLRFARGFLAYLVRLGLLKDNPAQRIPALKQKQHKPYIYTLLEIQRILEAARGHQCRFKHCFAGQTMETMVLLVYACGLRRGEAVNLRVEDVDFDQGTLSLWKTKFHKERLVPFSPEVGRRLKAYLASPKRARLRAGPRDPFFAHAKGKYNKVSIRNLFVPLLKRAGIDKPKGRGGPRFHDLRHTFAVHRLYKWYQEGHEILNKLPLLSTYMGHVDIEGTQVYLTITQALLREGNRRFQDTFGGIADKALERALKKQ